MKKVILYTLTICAMLIVTACGGDSNDSGYKTYKEALAANDFEAVHKILDQAEADKANLNNEDFSEKYGFGSDWWELRDVKMEVLRSELIYLVSQNGEGINDRIVFLINENKELLRQTEKNDDYCDYVATLAANRQNEELIKMLVSLYTDPYLFLDNSAVARYGKDKDFYYELVLDILNNGPKINNEPSLGLVKADDDEELETYRSCISKYNQKCINLIEAFIDKGDIESARKAQRLVKKNIKFRNLGDWTKVVEKTDHSSIYDAYDVQRDDEDFKKAAKMIKMQS